MHDSTKRCYLALFSAVLIVGASHPSAEIFAAENSSGRYQMQKTDDGILRLDTQTGQMSLCSDTAGRWSCESIESGQAASGGGDRVAKLERENEQLKDDVKRLEGMIGLDGATPKKRDRFVLPSEEDVDRAMTMVEKMLKRFKDALEDLENKDGTEKKGTPL